MIPVRIIKEKEFQIKDIFGVRHYVFKMNEIKYKNNIIATMHNIENCNNLEVLKFALWCKKNDIGITMYGMLNQLPLFGIFADSVILQDRESWSTGIYPEKEGNPDATHYDMKNLFCNFKTYASPEEGEENRYSFCLDLSRSGGCSEEKWPLLLSLADREISDEEVSEHFKFPCLYMREEALTKYIKMKKEGTIPDNLIMCEVRVSGGCGGSHLLSILREKTKDYEIPICTDLDYRKKLCAKSGQDYMSVQILCSLMSNWMWIAYGGSSNILPFFPIKILSVSDVFCRLNLIRTIFSKRFVDFCGVFPELETLIYCFPEEKDGPSRIDGHKPLPNLKKFTKDFSEYKLNFEFVGKPSSAIIKIIL